MSIIVIAMQGIVLGLSAAITPGPFQAYLLSQTMRSGWQRTLPATIAPIATDGFIIGFVLLVLTTMPVWFLNGLQIIGGGFILYLAWNTYRTLRTTTSLLDVANDSATQSFLNAIVVNILNPNPYIFWSVVAGPILLHAWHESPAYGIAFVGSFYGSLVSMLVILVMLFAFARRFGDVVVQVLLTFSVVALAFFGAYQLWQGIVAYVVE